MKRQLTVKDIEHLVFIARQHRMQPIRYASTDVRTIKRGTFKGMKLVRKGAKPRRNGKEAFYILVLGNRTKENAYFVDAKSEIKRKIL